MILNQFDKVGVNFFFGLIGDGFGFFIGAFDDTQAAVAVFFNICFGSDEVGLNDGANIVIVFRQFIQQVERRLQARIVFHIEINENVIGGCFFNDFLDVFEAEIVIDV